MHARKADQTDSRQGGGFSECPKIERVILSSFLSISLCMYVCTRSSYSSSRRASVSLSLSPPVYIYIHVSGMRVLTGMQSNRNVIGMAGKKATVCRLMRFNGNRMSLLWSHLSYRTFFI